MLAEDDDLGRQGADGFAVDVGQTGDDILMGEGEVLGLALGDFDALADFIEQFGMFGQAPLQMHQGDDIFGQLHVALF